MAVRAKFVCNTIEQFAWKQSYGDTAWRVKFGVVFQGLKEQNPNGENRIFGDASPSGDINITICNPAAVEQFTPGQQYYVDFTPAPHEDTLREFYNKTA